MTEAENTREQVEAFDRKLWSFADLWHENPESPRIDTLRDELRAEYTAMQQAITDLRADIARKDAALRDAANWTEAATANIDDWATDEDDQGLANEGRTLLATLRAALSQPEEPA